MLENHIFVLPIVLVIYLPVSFIITYAIAVKYNHVEPGFPYISDTGTSPPESCIFGQLLNIGALICSVVMYTRYKQIEKFYRESSRKKLMIANKVSFVLGLTACLGVSIVGNFQETNVLIVHLIGAFLAFGIGGIYCYIQAAMSFRMTDLPGNCLKLRIFRVVLCFLDLLLQIALFVSAEEAMSQETFQTNNLKWTADYPGYREHLVSTISEWLVALLTAIFVATFAGEFRKFRLKAPEVIYYDIQEESNKEMHISAPKFVYRDMHDESIKET
ncbi:hypothetical protein CHS0354_040792 [Potamilus streckersoni]|uniref:CWH43-like N-terminal domain-containing protein n=1 Tax=Potamilus streckersoni TaxID=2493646 RepID=A0AAE0SLQ9_9BIVA|nr:hypothetical protein CHS0354_040792 [Potamilus streckersoni]